MSVFWDTTSFDTRNDNDEIENNIVTQIQQRTVIMVFVFHFTFWSDK